MKEEAYIMHDEDIFLKEAEALHNLRVLEEIERNPGVSQRELSKRLGVALGITNSLIKTLVRKGLIKIRGDNNRSLTYHLTHAGVLAKSQLAMKWTLNTIDYYRQARQSIANKLAVIAQRGVKTIVLYGAGELLEIVAVVAPEAGLEIIGIINDQSTNNAVLGYSVIKFEELTNKKPDAMIVCVSLDKNRAKELEQRIGNITRLHRLI